MTKVTHKILCNACKVELDLITEDDPQTWGCPNCGVNDTTDNVMREVAEYAEEVYAQAIQDRLSDTFKGGKDMKFSAKRVQQRVYRFITVPIGDDDGAA